MDNDNRKLVLTYKYEKLKIYFGFFLFKFYLSTITIAIL
jgi:hypothetical protein